VTGYPRWDAWWIPSLKQGAVVRRESPDDPDHRAVMRSVRASAPIGWVVVTSHATSAEAVAWVEQMEGGRYVSRLECGCAYHYERGHVSSIERCEKHDSYKIALRFLREGLEDEGVQAS
jgi:hypothetical protein